LQSSVEYDGTRPPAEIRAELQAHGLPQPSQDREGQLQERSAVNAEPEGTTHHDDAAKKSIFCVDDPLGCFREGISRQIRVA
jgi:hypothetical protein